MVILSEIYKINCNEIVLIVLNYLVDVSGLFGCISLIEVEVL